MPYSHYKHFFVRFVDFVAIIPLPARPDKRSASGGYGYVDLVANTSPTWSGVHRAKTNPPRRIC